MPTAYLSIGSNQGDRHAYIERAVALIAQAYPTAELHVSDPIETEPWGYESSNAYINIAVSLTFDNGQEPEPLALLITLQKIEKEISPHPHRNTDGTYRDREIDIDIIEIDNVEMATPQLTLPHPRAQMRPFVMIPLKQLKTLRSDK